MNSDLIAWTLRSEFLLRDGKPVTLPPKDLETLLVLVERAGHIVNKEELLERVWPGVFIEEGNLARHIFNLRKVMGIAWTHASTLRPSLAAATDSLLRFTRMETRPRLPNLTPVPIVGLIRQCYFATLA